MWNDLAWYRLQIGQLVCEVEGRHIGRIEAIHNSVTARIRWLDTGWISEMDTRDLEKAPREQRI